MSLIAALNINYNDGIINLLNFQNNPKVIIITKN